MPDIIRLDEVDSTNSYLKARCGELPDGTVVTARLQTAGRGRRGHVWAADESMLPLSILLKDPPDIGSLTARVGLAVCEALENICGDKLKAGIKWANDVIVCERKVCGILCENVLIGDCANVVIGIGVNVSQSEAFFTANELPHASSLLVLTGKAPDRETLLSAIVSHVKELAAVPFSECIGEYRTRLINLDREVRLISAEGERAAIAVDVTSCGHLVCRDEDGLFEVSSGEVSVRGIDGYL